MFHIIYYFELVYPASRGLYIGITGDKHVTSVLRSFTQIDFRGQRDLFEVVIRTVFTCQTCT